ncbi:uncharacterized protein LOC114453412 isoform X2 [Parambassis ranga]|uniref:Uncharacterized protein LOC114453412 isoform X2 n=1 Tax=Parambassis ranga TaxID=210632 RepID=A0A6P7KHR9_9TELE|nr:uncharacterized protein LOC114453412 isoform X2 [Parambassis ranga]
MKLAILCLCILQLDIVSCRIFTRNNLQATYRGQASQSTGFNMSRSRVKPLFARRGHYERQRIYVLKPRVVTAAPLHMSPTPEVTPVDPVSPKCSELAQSCLPQSGCCDPCAACHCRFFNAICFCRRVSSQCGKKT